MGPFFAASGLHHFGQASTEAYGQLGRRYRYLIKVFNYANSNLVGPLSNDMSLNESDTRAKLIDPVIHGRGWTEDLIRREETAGAIEIVGGKAKRRRRGARTTRCGSRSRRGRSR